MVNDIIATRYDSQLDTIQCTLLQTFYQKHLPQDVASYLLDFIFEISAQNTKLLWQKFTHCILALPAWQGNTPCQSG